MGSGCTQSAGDAQQKVTHKDDVTLVTDAEAAENLYNVALDLLRDPARQAELRRNIQPLARPDATSTIVDELEALIDRRQSRNS